MPGSIRDKKSNVKTIFRSQGPILWIFTLLSRSISAMPSYKQKGDDEEVVTFRTYRKRRYEQDTDDEDEEEEQVKSQKSHKHVFHDARDVELEPEEVSDLSR